MEHFEQTTRMLVEAFADCAPYGGAFTDPHPTVAVHVDHATADSLERILTPGLPISTHVERLTLLAEDDEGQWTVARSWPLGNGDAKLSRS